MYYIVNQTKQIVAADKSLLELLHVKDIDELRRKIILEEIRIESHEEKNMIIHTTQDTLSFDISSSHLFSILGELTLINLSSLSEHKDETKLVDMSQTLKQKPYQKNEYLNINISKISHDIGISTQDYKTFLNEYIDTAISLETNLRNKDSETRTSAINTLTQLSNILQLPYFNTMMNDLKVSSPQNHMSTVDSFYLSLSKLTIDDKNDNKIQHTSIQINEKIENKTQDLTIHINNIKPIPIIYNIEKTAKHLSLPIPIVEEFINDFIYQTDENIPKILEAYQQEDMTTIKTIAQTLQEVSDNLDIQPLSETLHSLGTTNDSNQIKKFINYFWGQFLTFKQLVLPKNERKKS